MIGRKKYITISPEQVEKVGNTLIYLSDKIDGLAKTKALKLIYLLDEISIKRYGIPFFNLKYKVWKLGPVSEELYIDLNEPNKTYFGNHIKTNTIKGVTYIKPLHKFNDDEFSKIDIDLLNEVVIKFGKYTAEELVKYTHKKNSPWSETAIKNNVLKLLTDEKINNTEYIIDMSTLIKNDTRKKGLYKEYCKIH